MITWTRAKACGEAACIEIAPLSPGRIGIRDSKRPLEYFVTSPEDFTVFLTGAKAGDFDHLIADQIEAEFPTGQDGGNA